jgi:hypothetical protein
MANALDQGFGRVIAEAGLGGLEFSWDTDGNLYFGESLTPEQKEAIEAAAAAYKAEAPKT